MADQSAPPSSLRQQTSDHPLDTTVYDVPSAIVLAVKVKNIAEEHQKLNLLKENEGLLQAINEMHAELVQQQENITSTLLASSTIQGNLNSLCSSWVDIFNYFDELQNTTVLFLTKPKLKRKAVAVTQALRSKGTQLMTNVTLELLLRKQPETVQEESTSDIVYQLPAFYKYYYGVAGSPVNYTMAYTKARESAEKNHNPRAMLLLSKCYFRGHGVPADPIQARKWLDQAVELDLPEAKKELAEILIDSFQDIKSVCKRVINPEKTAKELREEHASSRRLSRTSEDSDELPPKPTTPMGKEKAEDVEEEKLRKVINLLLDASHGKSFETLGNCVQAETLMGQLWEEAEAFKQAEVWYNTAITQHCTDAMNRLGLIYYYGRGNTDKKPEEAYKLFLDAALAGNVAAYNNVGMCVEYGNGTPISIFDALQYYRAGAKLGCSDAMYSAGYLLIRQYLASLKNIQNSYDHGPSFFNQFSNGRVDGSMSSERRPYYRLSSHDRAELDKTSLEGVHWLRSAAEHGVVEATYQLGRVYEQVILFNYC